MGKVVSLFKTKSFKAIILAVLFAASAVIALALMLGQEAGSFVVKVSDDEFDRKIRLSETYETPDTHDAFYYPTSLSATSPDVYVTNSDGSVTKTKLASRFSDYTSSLILLDGYSQLDEYQSTYAKIATSDLDVSQIATYYEGMFEKTADMVLSSGKTYYTLAATDAYTKVVNPSADELANYYELVGHRLTDDVAFKEGKSYYMKRPALQYVTDSQGNCALYIYTFYLINKSATAVSVNATMKYSNVTNGIDECIRVMTYAKTSTTSDPVIYYKPDVNKQIDYYSCGYLKTVGLEKFTPNSTSDGIVFDNQTYRISADDGANYVKYSVYIWIEGNDPDEDPSVSGYDIKNGVINFDLSFKLV